MRTVALLLLVLTATFVSGCAVPVKYIEVSPECVPPPEPATPRIDRGQLWDDLVELYRHRGHDEATAMTLGDTYYRRIELYINTLWGAYDEQAAMLRTLCAVGDTGS